MFDVKWYRAWAGLDTSPPTISHRYRAHNSEKNPWTPQPVSPISQQKEQMTRVIDPHGNARSRVRLFPAIALTHRRDHRRYLQRDSRENTSEISLIQTITRHLYLTRFNHCLTSFSEGNVFKVEKCKT